MKVELVDYTKRIKNVTVLDHVNLLMEGGKVYGLRGANGSGKSMLLRAICGLIKPSEGCVEIDGHPLTGFPPSVGLLIEEPDFIGRYTGFQNLASIAGIKRIIGFSEIECALRELGLDPKDQRPYRKYSLGMRQRLGIVCALMENPDLILLDEPFNGLDEDGISLAKAAICKRAAQGSLCIVACHERKYLDEISDTIAVIADGGVISA